MKLALATLSASLVALAMTTAASAAPQLNLTLTYVGSSQTPLAVFVDEDFDPNTPDTVDTSALTVGAGYSANPNLTTLDLTQAASQASSWTHYYKVGFTLVQDPGVTTTRFRLALISLSASGGMALSTAGPITQQVWYPNAVNGAVGASNNQGEFEVNADAGTSIIDGLNIDIHQTTAARAYTTGVGLGGLNVKPDGGSPVPQQVPTPVGFFGVQFTTPGAFSTLSVTQGIGNVFSYFTANNNNTYTTTTTGINAATVSFNTAPTPEPASLGVLALGGVALLARRRKA